MSAQGFLYNCKIAEFQSHFDFSKINQEYSTFKFQKDENFQFILDANGKKIKTDWLAPVPPQVLRNACYKWFGAMNRWKQKLGKKPKFKNKSKKNKLFLTKELYDVFPIEFDVNMVPTKYRIDIFGNKHTLMGYGEFECGEQGFELPNAVYLTKIRNKVKISFAFEDGIVLPTDQEMIEHFSQFSYDELTKITAGIDSGVIHPFIMGNIFFDWNPVVMKRMIRKAIHKKRYQKKLARQIQTQRNGGKPRKKGAKCKAFVKGEKIELSKNAIKTKQKIAKLDAYIVDARSDFLHQTSRKIVNSSDLQIFAFEDLKIKNMTKKSKAKMVDDKWVRNNKKQKSGLNKAILNVGWGRCKTMVKYKARKLNKLVLVVPPFYSSQECSACHYTSAENRKTQSEFHCLKCGHNENADINANKILKHRSITMLVDNKIKVKVSKKVGFRKKGGANDGSPKEEIPKNVCEGSVSRDFATGDSCSTYETENSLIFSNIL
jgi:putative transposase